MTTRMRPRPFMYDHRGRPAKRRSVRTQPDLRGLDGFGASRDPSRRPADCRAPQPQRVLMLQMALRPNRRTHRRYPAGQQSSRVPWPVTYELGNNQNCAQRGDMHHGARGSPSMITANQGGAVSVLCRQTFL